MFEFLSWLWDWYVYIWMLGDLTEISMWGVLFVAGGLFFCIAFTLWNLIMLTLSFLAPLDEADTLFMRLLFLLNILWWVFGGVFTLILTCVILFYFGRMVLTGK